MKVLVVSAHPDDETLGCGGTLLKHRDSGDRLFWVRVTQPREPQWSSNAIQRKEAEVEKVAAAYGMEECHNLTFPAARLDTIPMVELIDGIDRIVRQVRPEVAYLVHGGDVHTDHRELFTAFTAVLKPLHMQRLTVRRVLCYETLSSTEAAPPDRDSPFLPHVFVDITPWIDEKIRIMGLYETEAQPDPLPRGPEAIRALGRYRGATIGVEYAEAFQLVREIL